MNQYRYKYHKESNSCSCNMKHYDCPNTCHDPVGTMPLAMAYVPWQQWGDVYTGECGLAQGTIFPDLVKPYCLKCGERR